jgi:hypothetical protein
MTRKKVTIDMEAVMLYRNQGMTWKQVQAKLAEQGTIVSGQNIRIKAKAVTQEVKPVECNTL